MAFPMPIRSRAFQFSVSVCKAIQERRADQVDWVIRRQLIRSSTSIGANIIEAQHSSSRQEFLRYIQISLRSARESEYWLRLFFHLDVGSRERVKILLEENTQISKILATIVLKTKGLK